MQKSYEIRIQRLIEIVKRIHENEWSSTDRKKAIKTIANKLKETADLLRLCGSAQQDIELFHDECVTPAQVTGLNGLPIEQDSVNPSYRSIQQYVQLLAKSACLAAEQLPAARTKNALKFAARGLLHLRYDYDFPQVSLYDNSEDVIELERICKQLGIHLSRERLRGALSESFKTFDPRFMEAGFEQIYK